MKILKSYPPNYTAIAAAFPIKGKPGILYAWGPKLYNPSGIEVYPWLMAHEKVHSQRQMALHDAKPDAITMEQNILDWWDHYIHLPGFRLHEELLAHRAEWAAYLEMKGIEPRKGQTYLETIAKRLSSPIYGSMINFEDAKREIAA